MVKGHVFQAGNVSNIIRGTIKKYLLPMEHVFSFDLSRIFFSFYEVNFSQPSQMTIDLCYSKAIGARALKKGAIERQYHPLNHIKRSDFKSCCDSSHIVSYLGKWPLGIASFRSRCNHLHKVRDLPFSGHCDKALSLPCAKFGSIWLAS